MTANNNKLLDRTNQHRALAVAYGCKELFNTQHITIEQIITEHYILHKHLHHKSQQAHEQTEGGIYHEKGTHY
jgi:hypothetical protein